MPGSPLDDISFSYRNASTGVARNGIINQDDMPPVSCDFDGSMTCDITDVDLLVEEIVDVKSGGMPDLGFDINSDGTVDNDDLDQWLAVAGAENAGVTGGNPFLGADANLDGNVDGQDFIAWNSGKFTADTLWSGGDWNADGVTDGQDFVLWNSLKFTSSSDVNVVPEPALSMVWISLCVGLCLRRRWA